MKKLALLLLLAIPSLAFGVAPTLTSIFPASNISAGGALVTLTGTNFIAGATVTIGGNSCTTLTVVSGTSITCYAPPGTAGTTVDVVVTTSGGSATLTNGFRYGSILFSSGFETGDFSEWSAYYQHNANVNSVITGTPGGDVHSGTKAYRIHFVICGVDVPAATTLGQTAGTHPGTYYVRYTYYTTDGFEGAGHAGETKASVEQSFTVTAGNDLTVASPPAAIGLTGWNVYISDSAGNEKLQNSPPIDIGTNYTLDHALLTVTAPPTTNTACGTASIDNNQGVYQYFRTAQGYPTGIHHVFVRGWVKFHANPGETSPELGHIQRKTYYLKGAIANGQFGFASTVTTYSPATQLSLRMTRSVYAPPRASYCDPTGIYGGSEGVYTYTYDTWYAIEQEWLQNSPGVADGAYRLWVTPQGGATTLAYAVTGVSMAGNCTDGVDSITVGQQVNRYYATDVVDEYRYWDDVVIADAYIGPAMPGAAAVPAPAFVTFNSTQVGNTSADSPEIVTLSNPGGLILNISDISITGTHAGDFSLDSTTCGATLPIGASCTVNLSFTPTGLGARTANLVFTDDAADSPQSVSLSGTGTAVGAPVVSLSESSLYFAARTVGTTSYAQEVILENTGDATLNITSIVVSTTSAPTSPGDFAIDSTTCGATLAAAASCAVNVSFTPVAGGSRTGRIRFTTDAASSPDDVSTSGTGQIVLTLRGGTFRGLTK